MDLTDIEGVLSLPSSQVRIGWQADHIPKRPVMNSVDQCTLTIRLSTQCVADALLHHFNTTGHNYNYTNSLVIGKSQSSASFTLHTVQVLALFSKTVRKLYQHIRSAKEAAVERSLPAVTVREAPSMLPHEVGVEEELDEAARAVRARGMTCWQINE